jgi:single-stranded-DNA-specific exonuclease
MPSAQAVAALGDIDPLHARLFAMRGLKNAAELDYGLAQLAPVGALENIDEAAELVIANRDKKIIVVGDFDVDGATSTALVLRCLREYGFTDVDYLVPNRFEYGYGLSPEIVRVAAEKSPSLLITVDNGVSSVSGVTEANKLDIRYPEPEFAGQRVSQQVPGRRRCGVLPDGAGWPYVAGAGSCRRSQSACEISRPGRVGYRG